MLIAFVVLVICPAVPELLAQEYRWEVQSLSPNISYSDIACSDSLHAVAVGGNGQFRQVVQISEDSGNTWRLVYSDSVSTSGSNAGKLALTLHRVVHPTKQLIVIACDSGRILRSPDAGYSWQMVQIPTNDWLISISMPDSLFGICTTITGEVFRTTTGGMFWDRLSVSDSLRLYGCRDVSCSSDRTALILSTRDRCVWRTDDGGTQWRKLGVAEQCNRIISIGTDTAWAIGSPLTGNGDQRRNIIRRTIDGGNTWQSQIDSVAPTTRGVWAVAFRNTMQGLAVGSAGLIYRTRDAGTTWTVEYGGTEDTHSRNYSAVAYPGFSTALIATMQGDILRQGFVPGTVADGSNNRDGELEIQAMPNPIQPGSAGGHIEYRIGRGEHVRLNLIDIRGRRIATLDEGWREPGEHVVTLPDNLAAGTYFARIQTASSACCTVLTVVP